jgi:hypothetical protein
MAFLDIPTVMTIAVQPDGKVLIGGYFDSVAGQPRKNLARLDSTLPATHSLAYDGWTVTWLRGGSSPEISSSSFQASTNGLDWLALGAGERIPGGWRCAGATLPANAMIRASGLVAGGQAGGSSWFVRDTLTVDPLTPPVILADDGALGAVSNRFGFNVAALAGQGVVVEGSWDLRNWTALATNVVRGGLLYFSDPGSPGLPWRFYRARLE